MSIFSNVTEQGLIILRKLAEQQKEQRALEIKNRILKQTHDIKLAESLSPITKKLDTINESTNQLGERIKKSEVEDGNTETSAIENTNISRSLFDTLSHMKGIKNFFKLEEKDDGEVFWNKIPIKALGENRIIIKDREYDIKPNIQTNFTYTKLTTKNMVDEDKSTVYDILKNNGFYSMKHTKGLNSARMRDAFYNHSEEKAKIRNPPLPAIEIESDNLQGEGVKIIKTSNIIDIYTRLEILLGLKLSGHSDTLLEASNLIDELYKRGEIQTKQQYRNALNKPSTQ